MRPPIFNAAALEQLKHTAEYRQGMAQIAEDLAQNVRDQAPQRSGHYRSSIKTFDTGTQQGVAAHDVAAHLIEFGSVNNPPYAPLRRGIRAAGLRLDESPKQ